MSDATKKAIIEKAKSIKKTFTDCAELIDEIVKNGGL